MLDRLPQTRSERVDDLPLILHWLETMGVARELDSALDPAHKNRVGLSYGQLSVLLITYSVSQGDHRLCAMEAWVRAHHQTLEAATGWTIGDKDMTDDRLAALLSVLGGSAELGFVEERLSRQQIRAYDLPTAVARCDGSSFSVYHEESEAGPASPLLNYGYSKDHRPDLRQYRQMLGTLDPAGIPLVSATLPGNGNDDTLYYPFWLGLVSAIGHRDFLYIADCKAASYENRAKIQRGQGRYCFPLALTGRQPEQLKAWVLNPPAQRQTVTLPASAAQPVTVVEGFEVELGQLWTDPDTQQAYRWVERHLVIRSASLAQRQQQGLQQRLARAAAGLTKLAAKPAKDHCDLKQQVTALLQRHRVQECFTWDIHAQLVTRAIGRGRPNPQKPKPTVSLTQFQLQFQTQPDAIAQAVALTGWRIYVTNVPAEQLSWFQAILYYREQWQLERGFHRFKRGRLPALPICLQDDQRIIGLMFLLTLALRVFTLMEFVVRRQLQQDTDTLPGLYAGNPKRTTARPSAEHLLSAFGGITRYFHRDGSTEISPLSPLQQKILTLMAVPLSIYAIPTLNPQLEPN
jgi:transposase